MKIISTILLTAITLYAGLFESVETQSRDSRLKSDTVRELFRTNVSDANAIVKRGEYLRFAKYDAGMERVNREISSVKLPADDKQRLKADLKAHAALVKRIGDSLKSQAPDLNDNYRRVIKGLQKFNKKLASIGLAELLRDWRELSRIKNRFVKKPNSKYVKQFDEKWTAVTVTITELYLDEEIEAPLFAYLDHYKAYFQQLNAAYKRAGYREVVKLKPLSYKIKMQLQLIVPMS
jgi:hypothetical protein